MTFDISITAKTKLSELRPFIPGKSIDEVKKEFQLNDVVKLASNENPLGPGALALEAIENATKSIHIYPDGNGASLKQSLSSMHNVEPEQIILGNGSEEVMLLLAQSFVAKGEEIITSNHEYVTYELIARKVGARPVIVTTKNWAYDLEEMVKSISPSTRMFFIANPRNPTGTKIERSALIITLDAIPKSVIIVVDEAYFEYIEDGRHTSAIDLISQYPNLVVTRTFSKIYGLAGLRIGYGVTNSLIASVLNRTRMPFNVNKIAQVAALASLKDEFHLKNSLKVNHDGKLQLIDAMQNMTIEYLPSFGNFITIYVKNMAQVIYQRMLAEGIIVRPLEGYGMPNHIRITIGTFKQNERLISAFKKVINQLDL